MGLIAPLALLLVGAKAAAAVGAVGLASACTGAYASFLKPSGTFMAAVRIVGLLDAALKAVEPFVVTSFDEATRGQPIATTDAVIVAWRDFEVETTKWKSLCSSKLYNCKGK